MSNRREVAGEWVGAHRSCCKVASCVLLCFSLAFMIAGAVVVSNNQMRFDEGTFEERSQRSLQMFGGSAMLALSIFLMFTGLVSMCMAWQLGFAKRAIDGSGGDARIFSGAAGQTRPYGQEPPVPSQPPAYPGQQPFYPQPPYPPMPGEQPPYQPMPPPPMPPSYTEATAPPLP